VVTPPARVPADAPSVGRTARGLRGGRAAR
jgi:hypothetical protein